MSYHDDTTPEAHPMLPERSTTAAVRVRADKDWKITVTPRQIVSYTLAIMIVAGGILRFENFMARESAFEDNVLHRLIVIEHHLNIPDHESQAPMLGPVSMKGQP